MQRCTKASAQLRQEVTKGTDREYVGAENIVRRRWSQGPQGIMRVDASERELLKRELRRNVLRDSDVWNSLRGGIQRWGGDG